MDLVFILKSAFRISGIFMVYECVVYLIRARRFLGLINSSSYGFLSWNIGFRVWDDFVNRIQLFFLIVGLIKMPPIIDENFFLELNLVRRSLFFFGVWFVVSALFFGVLWWYG